VKVSDQNMFPSRSGARHFDRALLATLLVMAAAAIALGQTPGRDPIATPRAFPSQPNLSDFLNWAQAHSPRLQAQAARVFALRENARQAGALPRLQLAWGEMIVPVETRVGPQQRVLSVSQSIPWFGTLADREHSLESAANAAQEMLRGLTWQVQKEVRAAWYELAFVQGQLAIVRQNLELARQTEVHTRARYEAGEGSYAAVLAAQMELGRLDTHQHSLRDRLVPVTTQLNLAAGMTAARPAPPPADLPSALIEAELPTPAVLSEILVRNNPTLASWRHQQQSRRHGVTAAGRRSYPDLTVGLDYIMTGEARNPDVPDSGQDPVVARLAVKVPLWGGQADAEQQAAAGLLRSASAGLADTRLQLTGQLENILYQWREAGRNLELYGTTLLPRSAQNLAVVTANYESGQATFDQLQTARQAQLGLELARLRAAKDRLLAWNDLSALLGVSVDDLARGTLPVFASEPENESD